MRQPRTIQLVLLSSTLAWGTCHGADVHNRVVIEHGTLAIDHNRGIAQITQAQSSGGFRASHSAEIGLGLFQNRMTTSLEPGPTTGKGLALVTRIKTEPVIYVAREFPVDSCAYRVVLAHERQHYLYDREVLGALAREIRGITWATFSNPLPAGDTEMERAKKMFFQQFNHAYEGLSFPRHSRIDNPAAYAELARQCGGEIGKRLAAGQAVN